MKRYESRKKEVQNNFKEMRLIPCLFFCLIKREGLTNRLRMNLFLKKDPSYRIQGRVFYVVKPNLMF